MIKDFEEQKISDRIIGLSDIEVEERLEKFGPNVINPPVEISFLKIFKEELTEPMILLLLIIGIIYSVWGNLADAVTIFIVIVALVMAEVFTEYQAKKAITSLSKISASKTKVWRNNEITEVKPEELVPGDILILLPGTYVAADSKIISAISFDTDESQLTGESFPQERTAGEDIYAGTLILSGEGKARVFATGRNTKIGKLSLLASHIKEPRTPLQLAMKSLAKKLVWLSLFFSIFIPVLGLIRGQNLRVMILTGLALAFAVIPEELPIIVTMILGFGAYKLSQKNFIIKRIKAAETLGNATVIMADKTGTITNNKMRVVYLYPPNKKSTILESAINNLTDISISPTDKAILSKAADLNLDKNLYGKIIRERTFGDSRKTHSSILKLDDHYELISSGAPEEILLMIGTKNKIIEKEIEKEAEKGRRIIAVASKKILPSHKNYPFEKLEKDLKFIGLISIEDSPRPEVKPMIQLASQAGVRNIMVTGDHPKTASFVAEEVGIPSKKVLTGAEIDRLSDANLAEAIKETSVFARVSPEEKYRLVKAFQNNGEVVAVTGDGVNDALALKAANIGIAMGIKGTDAAKEAADVVLGDDNFATIGQGIFEGRKFFENLKKGTKYYLSVKIALIMIFLVAVIANVPFPLEPIQIIVLELFMDLVASAGFVYEPPENEIYSPSFLSRYNKFFDSFILKSIAFSALSLFASVTFVYLSALFAGRTPQTANAYAFAAWMIGTILLAFVSRSDYESVFKIGVFKNKIINIWAVGALIFFLVVISSPVISSFLKLVPLSFYQLLFVFAISFVAIFWQELLKKTA
ncbi:MAG: cation-transporting P-type ATPase [Patescibacteria group bacterium]|nr:cation-transporting P-type ATPase [Patescibacteria group bacterium]